MNNGARGHRAEPFEASTPLAAAGSAINVRFPHGRGRMPFSVHWTLVCLKADGGYVPGEEIDYIGAQSVGSLQGTSWRNAAEVGLVISSGSNGLDLFKRSDASSASLTTGRWALKVRATFY